MRTSDRNYLFTDGDLGDALRQQIRAAIQEVDAISEGQFMTSSDIELQEGVLLKYQITPLRLLEEARTMTKEDVKIDVTHHHDRNPFRDPGPIYVNGVRVTISVPFEGEPDLWKLRPNRWRTTFPIGNVEAIRDAQDGVLKLTFQQPSDTSFERIKQDLDSALADIRFYIEGQTQQISEEFARVPEQIAAAIAQRRQRLAKQSNLADILGIPERKDVPRNPESTLGSVRRPNPLPRETSVPVTKWDVFISHASEDKDDFARPLAKALERSGLKVWFDEFTLTIGDSLRRSIDLGLANSRFGIVIISPDFLKKEWPQRELDGLVAREIAGGKVILPVWHKIEKDHLLRYSPVLADRLATNSGKGLELVVAELRLAIGGG